MALPIDYFTPETFAQANPFLAGFNAGQATINKGLLNQGQQYLNQMNAAKAQYAMPEAQQQLLKDQLNNQILQPQAQYAPQLTLADLALKQTMPNYYNAQASLAGTEAAKNQFFLNNPTTLLPGIAGSIGAYNVLQKMAPNIFNKSVASPNQTQNTISNLDNGNPTQLPGMPSAGNFTGTNAGIPNSSSNHSALLNAISQQIGQNGANTILGVNQSSQIVPSSSGGIPNVQDFANLMFQGQFAPIQKDIAQTQFYNTKAGLANFQSLPPDTKANIIAQGSSIGMTPNQTVSFVSRGGDLNKLSGQMSQNGNSSLPMYAPSSKNVAQSQVSTAATASLNAISPTITNALAPYSRQIFGHSPKLIAQELTGSNPDQQAQALAARALAPEISSLRLKAMNANVGIEAIKEVQEKSMLELNNLQGAVSPEVFKLAYKYMDNWITTMNQTYNKSLYTKPGQPVSPNQINPTITKQLNGVTYQFINGKWHQT